MLQSPFALRGLSAREHVWNSVSSQRFPHLCKNLWKIVFSGVRIWESCPVCGQVHIRGPV